MCRCYHRIVDIIVATLLLVGVLKLDRRLIRCPSVEALGLAVVDDSLVDSCRWIDGWIETETETETETDSVCLHLEKQKRRQSIPR